MHYTAGVNYRSSIYLSQEHLLSVWLAGGGRNDLTSNYLEGSNVTLTPLFYNGQKNC